MVPPTGEENASRTLRLRAEIAELDPLTAWIAQFCAEKGVGDRDCDALTLAGEELFANTIEHGGGLLQSVVLTLERVGSTVALTYADEGAAFDPAQAGAPDVFAPAEDRRLGGLGLFLLGRLMRQVRYERRDGWNIVLLERSLDAGKVAGRGDVDAK